MSPCPFCADLLAHAAGWWHANGRVWAMFHDPIPGSVLKTTRAVEMPLGFDPVASPMIRDEGVTGIRADGRRVVLRHDVGGR